MPTEKVPHFECPVCNRKNVWKQAFAGKRAKCACGKIIDVPEFADLSFATALQSADPVAQSVLAKITIDKSRSVMADIPYRKGLQPEATPALSMMRSQIRNVVLPIVLIAAGLFAAAADSALATGGPSAVSSQLCWAP